MASERLGAARFAAPVRTKITCGPLRGDGLRRRAAATVCYLRSLYAGDETGAATYAPQLFLSPCRIPNIDRCRHGALQSPVGIRCRKRPPRSSSETARICTKPFSFFRLAKPGLTKAKFVIQIESLQSLSRTRQRFAGLIRLAAGSDTPSGFSANQRRANCRLSAKRESTLFVV
jgi:hypothetical protein